MVNWNKYNSTYMSALKAAEDTCGRMIKRISHCPLVLVKVCYPPADSVLHGKMDLKESSLFLEMEEDLSSRNDIPKNNRNYYFNRKEKRNACALLK